MIVLCVDNSRAIITLSINRDLLCRSIVASLVPMTPSEYKFYHSSKGPLNPCKFFHVSGIA